MKKFLSILKRIWFFNFIRRLYIASQYYNKKYRHIIKWGFRSREDTNFTYKLTEENLVYMAQAISLVTKKSYLEILDYFKEIQEDEELKNHVISTTLKSKERAYSDKEARFGRRLGWYAFARVMKPKVIVETGVDKGLGSVILCAALERNAQEGFVGRYYGTDINPAAGYLLQGKYRDYGEILYGDSIESLSNFKQEIDLFVNDSDHSADYEYKEYETIEPLLNDNSILLGDNAHCTDMLSKFSIKTKRQFIFFQEVPLDHWYPGCGIGISFKS